jgi:general secretion pathway protein H
MISRVKAAKRPRARDDRGFTILELLIVLAIMGLIGSLLVGARPSTSARVNGRAAAETLASVLREARSEAILQGRTTAVEIDTERRTYRIGSAGDRPLPDGVRISLLTNRGDVIDGSQGRIRFTPDGRSTGGRIDVVTPSGKTEVGIDWLSGRVSIVDHR